MVEFEVREQSLPPEVQFFQEPGELPGFGMLSWANIVYGLLRGHTRKNEPLPFTVGDQTTLEWKSRKSLHNKIVVAIEGNKTSLTIESSSFRAANTMIRSHTFIRDLPKKGLVLLVDEVKDKKHTFVVKFLETEPKHLRPKKSSRGGVKNKQRPQN